MPWRGRTAVAGLAISVVGLTGGVAVAAVTGALPIAAGDDGPSPTALSTPSHTPGPRTTNATLGPAPASDAASPDPNGQGPDATGPAKFGLCNAYASGQGGTNGGKLDSVAFQALATAAGGAGSIAAYCADAPHGAGLPPVSTNPAGPASDHANSASGAQGLPADPGSNGGSHRP